MRTPPKNEGFDMRPRVLDTDPQYKKLSPAAKELYTKLYSRACLSATKDDLFRDTQTHIRIYGTDVPVQKVREEFLKLNDLHIRFVCDKLVHTNTEIKNMDAVCLNLLWNASLDMEIESTAAFNRDKAAGKI